MEFKCKYCKKNFTSLGNLTKHQKTTKYCLKIQNENNLINNDVITHKCDYCKKDISKYHLKKHTQNCVLKYQHIIDYVEKKYDNSILELKETLVKKDQEINKLKKQSNEIQDDLKSIGYETEIRILRESKNNDELLRDIAIKAIEQKNEVITNMVKKYVKKQPRKQYDCSNVIYIITTSSLKNDRRYILGKAKNLTNRLSTYNKSDEHEVIFYQDCEDEEAMNAMEPFVFKKLNEHREQANRERFILPKDKNIDFFIDIIKNCFEFLK